MAMNAVATTFLRRNATKLGARSMSTIVAKPEGAADTKEFAIKFFSGDTQVSPWHDIPLEAATSGQFNFLCEIPKMTKAKMEVDTKAENNPIVQDEKKVTSPPFPRHAIFSPSPVHFVSTFLPFLPLAYSSLWCFHSSLAINMSPRPIPNPLPQSIP